MKKGNPVRRYDRSCQSENAERFPVYSEVYFSDENVQPEHNYGDCHPVKYQRYSLQGDQFAEYGGESPNHHNDVQSDLA